MAKISDKKTSGKGKDTQIEQRIEQDLGYGHEALAKFLKTLAYSDDDDALKVRQWLEQKDRDPMGTVLWLHDWVCMQFPLTEWDRLTNKNKSQKNPRQEKANQICLTARKLAGLLGSEGRPPMKNPLFFFSEKSASDLLRPLKRHLSPDETREPPHLLNDIFTGGTDCTPQDWPSMLRRLADYIEEQGKQPRPIARPNAQYAEPQRFTKIMAEGVERLSGGPCNNIVAALARLRFPELAEGISNQEVVRWLKNNSPLK